jgi:hypothetical protein
VSASLARITRKKRLSKLKRDSTMFTELSFTRGPEKMMLARLIGSATAAPSHDPTITFSSSPEAPLFRGHLKLSGPLALFHFDLQNHGRIIGRPDSHVCKYAILLSALHANFSTFIFAIAGTINYHCSG